MSEVFDKKQWVDRQSQYPTRRKLTNVSTSEETIYDVSREEGTVTVAGHPFNAANMNDLEDRIEGAVDNLQTNFQAGVDSIYDACVDKGSTPSSHSLADILEAIENISGGGGGIVNMFGTPTSDTPSNAEILTRTGGIYSDYYAYEGFGDNERGWVTQNLQDTLLYHFTDDSKYRPTRIEFCTNFSIFNGRVNDVGVTFAVSNNGSDWTTLCQNVISPTREQPFVLDLDINEYFSYFQFVVTGGALFTGLKNIRCYGEKEGGSGKGLDTIKNVFFAKSIVNANAVEIGGNGNGDDEQYAT